MLSNGLLIDHLPMDEEFSTSVNGSPSITKAYFNPLDEAGRDGYATQILYQVKPKQIFSIMPIIEKNSKKIFNFALLSANSFRNY